MPSAPERTLKNGPIQMESGNHEFLVGKTFPQDICSIYIENKVEIVHLQSADMQKVACQLSSMQIINFALQIIFLGKL